MFTLQRIAFLASSTVILGCADGPGSKITAPDIGSAQAPSAAVQGGGRPTECVGLFTGVAPGNLVVPEGKFCIIIGAVVEGNVKVESGAIGFHSHNSIIRGSVHSPGPIVFDVRVLDSEVGHNVDIRRTVSGTAGGICRSEIGGNVTLKDNAGSMNVGIGFPFDVCTAGNLIGGNVHVDNSTGVIGINNNRVDQSVHVNGNTGAITILVNTIEHTLECNDNVPPPVSAGNTAKNFVGQCQS